MAQSVRIELSQENITLTREVKARRKNMDSLTCLRAASNLVCTALDNMQKHREKAKKAGVKLQASLKWTKPCTIKVVVDDVVQFHSDELLTQAGFTYTFRPQTFHKLRIHLEAAFEHVEVWSHSSISYK